MDKKPLNTEWLNTKETKKRLKLSDCELMHLRLAGKIEFKKIGNGYFYNTINESQ